MRSGSYLLLVVLFFSASVVNAQTAPQNHAQIQLVAEDTGFTPGQTIWVGVLFKMDSGWHVYWRNPGDSGVPPAIHWTMPDGFHAGGVRWPLPARLDHGSIVDYGYEDQLLLMAPVKTAPSASAPAKITANMKYLICREICIPASAQVNLSLPRATGGTEHFSDAHKLFEATRAQFPKPEPGTWKISARADKDKNTFELTVRGVEPKKTVLFFPLDPGIIDNVAPQKLTPVDGGFSLTLQQSDLLTKSVPLLRGVLNLRGIGAYQIEARVTGQ